MTTPISNLVNNPSPSTLQPSTQNAQSLQNEFLQMLLTELQNQDPTQPVDDTQMIAQQAQFSSLQEMQNLNTNLVSLMAMQNVSQATGMIGHTVVGTDAKGNPLTGTVTGISFSSGTPVLQIGNATMNLSSVTSIS